MCLFTSAVRASVNKSHIPSLPRSLTLDRGVASGGGEMQGEGARGGGGAGGGAVEGAGRGARGGARGGAEKS